MNTSEEAITRLASRLSAGDHDALRECYQLWGAGVYTYAYRRLGSPQDAEDVTQQVFVAAWRNRSQLVPSEVALPAWLLGIARNKVADQLRAAARQTAQAKLAPLPAASAEPHESLLDRLVILEALNTLGPPRDEIIRLLFLQDKTHHQAAEELGLPLGTVKSHARRGLQRLRQILEEVDRNA